jgi:plasmid stability protein
MSAIHIRNVPEKLVVAIKERAARHGRSMQQELVAILEAATTKAPARVKIAPLTLVTVKTRGKARWNRAEIYGDDGR